MERQSHVELPSPLDLPADSLNPGPMCTASVSASGGANFSFTFKPPGVLIIMSGGSKRATYAPTHASCDLICPSHALNSPLSQSALLTSELESTIEKTS